MKKRLLSIVLSICMVMALMPQMVFAETSGSTVDGLEYTISDGKAKITGFRGTGTTVTIPSEINGYPVTSIRSQAFEFKKNITNVTFQSPSNVTTIGRSAFGHCSSLRSITLPDSVTAMGKMVFYKCESLTSIIIPGNVKSIHEKAFLGCTGLTSVMIPDSVTSIESEAFSRCTGLTSVTIPDSVTSIKSEAFSRCTGLTSVTIPDSVTSIERNAFSGCTGLASVTIPDSVKSIESETFLGCTGLASVTIPDSVTVIESRAFSGCTGLTSVTIPDSVKLIEMKAFSGCTNLKSIEIPRSVTSISNYAFEGCTSLESIFLPKDLDITNEKVPDATSQIRYSLDTERREVTITEIELGTGKDTVDIPDKICGYNVVAVVASEQSKVNAHICNSREVIASKALKTAGTCQSEAVYYNSCGICGKVYSNGDTFKGEKNSNNHTGGTEIRGAKDATCMEEGYTGDTYCKGCGVMLSAGSSKNKLNHDLVNIPAKDATVTETGNTEYWQCTVCDKYFSDADGTKEITDLESWKAGEGQIDKCKPEIIKGKGQSVTAGEKKVLSFTSNADFKDFLGVELDGKTLDEKNYTVKEGSTIVTLNADYVATLPAGEHTIGIVSESGTAETAFTVEEKAAPGTSDDSDKDNSSDKDNDSKIDSEDSVKTGDNTNLALWIALMLLCGAGITGNTIYTRRKRTNE